jgi:N-acetylglucosaminyl-diphospho-decaprenol L-rhamnosyltransferase
MMDVSFIIINYRSRDFLKSCLASIFKYAKTVSFEVIVVNNDAAPLEKFTDLANVTIIEHNVNKGFAEAANLGAQKAGGKILFFLNADTKLLDSNLGKLLEIFIDSSVGAAAPKLVLPDGSPQPWSVGREATFWSILQNNLGITRRQKLWLQNEKTAVAWASGAALAIPKDIFDHSRGFDEKFFMYFEDVDLCKRLRNLDKKILLVPDMKVLHIGGQSKSDTQEQKSQYYASQDYYFKKHFGKFSQFLIKFLRRINLFFSEK